MHVKYLCRNLNTLKVFNLPQVCCFQKFTISFWKLYLEGSSIRYFCICTIFEDADCCTHILYTQWHDVQCWYFLGKNTPINTLVFQTSGLQTSGHLDFLPSGVLDFCSSELQAFQISGFPDVWPSGLPDFWPSGLLAFFPDVPKMSWLRHFRPTIYATPISNS